MIKVNNISKKYKDFLAVDGISFDLQKGETIGFLGANGAGKSTTMKVIVGVISPDSGSVSVFGNNIAEKPIKAKKLIGYLSEDNPLPDDMYVREYLEYIANIYNLTNVKDRVNDSIEKFGLRNEYRKKINALSKGNRQKLGLAQTLIHNPEFLILDEPTSALDPNQQDEIKELIASIRKDKVVLFSTHILHDVSSLASRVIIIDKGRIKADKSIRDIESVEILFHDITNEDSCR